MTVFIGVGSNVEPEENVLSAVRMLREWVKVEQVSTFYRTTPLGGRQQAMFVNGVLGLQTRLPPLELKFDVLRIVEQRLGRVRTADANAPREIDLDLLLYGDLVVDDERLRIPDPDIRNRAFVAVPLLELAPDLVLPDTKEPLRLLPIMNAASDLEPLDEFSGHLKRLLRDEHSKS
jgi:2-amino-4-hydroxy-6-hydroxymethyldihydropteridine diphosphokinase